MNISERVVELGEKQLPFEGIACFPPEIQAALGNNWKKHEVLSFLINNSEMCRVLRKNTADFEMLEIVYFGKAVRHTDINDGIDGWLRHSLSGQALRNRLKVVSDWTAQRLNYEIAGGKKVKVLDLGAGPGPYAIETVKAITPQNQSLIDWRCIDIDRLAMDMGEERAINLRLDQIITFHHADFMSRESYPQTEEEKADFGLMIGILCGMTPEQATSCLKKVAPHFKPKAELLAATLLTKSFEEDPQVFRVLCNVLGWQLRPKTLSEVEDVFRQAGYEIKQIFSEREDGDGQYAIVHAVIPS